jgi:acetyl-CoA carboxylase biotin carboxylase subunit
MYYDPMISKLAAWGRTRPEAIDRLRRALDEYAVGGIKTTLPFFREIVRDVEFIDGLLDTSFIKRFNERRNETRSSASLSGESDVRRDMAIIAAALSYEQQVKSASPGQEASGKQPGKWKQSGVAALLESRR